MKHADEMSAMSLSQKVNFEISFPNIPDPVIDVWHALTCFLDAKRCLAKTFEVSQIAGHAEEFHAAEKLNLSVDEVTQLILERKLTGLRVYAGQHPRAVSYILTDGKEAGSQSTLRAQIDKQAKSPDSWNSLIEGLMTLYSCVGAWQWNIIYEAWQNASELHSYYSQFYGEPPPKVRRFIVKSVDGIGPDREFIDVSNSPGRCRQIISHITFYPTSEMWLGPHFWQYAKCTKEQALAADFFIEKRDTPHYLYLKCWPEPFTRPDGEQGRMQQRLWKLFFHENCEWPPGSGTICDEPMYGPPELMPADADRKSKTRDIQ